MARGCRAYGCKENDRSQSSMDQGLSFHKFPANCSLRERWIAAVTNCYPNRNIGREITKHDMLCSKHFLSSDYVQNRGPRLLKPNTVPSVFSLPSTMGPDAVKEIHTKNEMNTLNINTTQPECNVEEKGDVMITNVQGLRDSTRTDVSDILYTSTSHGIVSILRCSNQALCHPNNTTTQSARHSGVSVLKKTILFLQRPLRCLHCMRVFKSHSTLSLHMNVCRNVKTFRCQLCSTTYRTQSALMQHVRRKHEHKEKHTDTQKCKYTDTQGEKRTGTQKCNYTDTQGEKHTDTQKFNDTDIQEDNYIDAQEYNNYTSKQEEKHTLIMDEVEPDTKDQIQTDLKEEKYTGTQADNNSDTQVDNSTGTLEEKHGHNMYKSDSSVEWDFIEISKLNTNSPVHQDVPRVNSRKVTDESCCSSDNNRCPVCNKSFVTFDHLKKHIQQEHEHQPTDIEESSSAQVSLTENCQQVEEVKVKEENLNCLNSNFENSLENNQCKTLQKRSVDAVHQSSKSLSRFSNSSLREKIPKRSSMLESLGQEPFSKTIYQCMKCGKCFTTGEFLKVHVKLLHKRTYKCDICIYSTTNSQCFNIHQQSVHPTDTSQTYALTDHSYSSSTFR